MSPDRKFNILIAPVVIFVRIPLLLPFYVLATVGEWAEGAGRWIGRYVPGFRQEYRS